MINLPDEYQIAWSEIYSSFIFLRSLPFSIPIFVFYFLAIYFLFNMLPFIVITFFSGAIAFFISLALTDYTYSKLIYPRITLNRYLIIKDKGNALEFLSHPNPFFPEIIDKKIILDILLQGTSILIIIKNKSPLTITFKTVSEASKALEKLKEYTLMTNH